MLITLLIISVASLLLNGYQYAERKAERKETNKLIADGALLEDKMSELQAKYDNEVLHKEWAIGRIKDQQAVIDRLSAITIPSKKTFKSRKEVRHD